jgi:hypothetical protein
MGRSAYVSLQYAVIAGEDRAGCILSPFFHGRDLDNRVSFALDV